MLALPFGANAAEPFYDGKVLTLVVGGVAGASYDLYARLLAQFLPKYIPGQPTIVVEDMPGANGGVSAAYMFHKAPADGTMIAECVSNLPTFPLLHPEIAQFDATKFSWIGSITKDVYIAYVWHTAPIQSYEQAKETPVIMGGVLAGSASVQFAVVSNALFGTKFKIVPGYELESKIELAIERGEVQGSFGGVYSTMQNRPFRLAEGWQSSRSLSSMDWTRSLTCPMSRCSSIRPKRRNIDSCCSSCCCRRSSTSPSMRRRAYPLAASPASPRL